MQHLSIMIVNLLQQSNSLKKSKIRCIAVTHQTAAEIIYNRADHTRRFQYVFLLIAYQKNLKNYIYCKKQDFVILC